MAGKKNGIKNSRQAIMHTFKSFGEYKIPKLGASLAYYTVFSMAPLLVMIISLAGIFLGTEAVQGKIVEQLSAFVGHDTAIQLQDLVHKASIAGKSAIAAIIGGITLLLGATTVFGEIQDSINSIWGLKAKPGSGWWKLVKNRLLSFSVIASLGFLLLVSLSVSAIIDAIANNLKAQFPDVTVVVFYIINLLLSFIIITAIFGVIFKVLPDAVLKWKDIRTGAILTSLLFMLGKLLISLYISKTNIGSTYGAAGSLVILLLWVYYSSIILYFGAAFTKNHILVSGSAIRPNSYAVTTKLVKIDTGKEPVKEKAGN